MSSMTVPGEQEPVGPPAPVGPPESARVPEPQLEENQQGPPAASMGGRYLPPDIDDKLMRLIKARADSSMKTVMDDRGRVSRLGFESHDEAMLEAADFLAKYLERDWGKAELWRWLDGGSKGEKAMAASVMASRRDSMNPMTAGTPAPEASFPEHFIRNTNHVKSQETRMLELRAELGRKESPVLAAVHDYVIDPLGNIIPTALQTVTDMGVGAANMLGSATGWWGDIAPKDAGGGFRDLTAATGNTLRQMFGLGGQATTRDELAAIAATAKGSETIGRIGGDMVGMGLGFVAGGPALKPGAMLGEVAGKALFKGTVKVAEKVAGKTLPRTSEIAGMVGKKVGHGSGSFAQYETMVAREEDGSAPSWMTRLEATGHGAAAGAVLGFAQGAVSLGLRGLFKTPIAQMDAAEKGTMSALKKWAVDNKVFPLRHEMQHIYDKRVVDLYVAARLPNAPYPMPIRRLIGHSMKAGADAGGFSALDQTFMADLTQAVVDGDVDGLVDLIPKFLGNYVGAAVLHGRYSSVVPGQRKGKVKATGEAPKAAQEPVAAPQEPATAREILSEAPRGGALEAGSTRLEGDPVRGVDPATLKATPEPAKVNPATGTVMEPPAPYDLTRVGWWEGEVAPGTLQSALAAKANLPGVEVSLGWYAFQGKLRTVKDGKVYESELSINPVWKEVAEVEARRPDALEPKQQQLVDALKAVRNSPDLALTKEQAEQFSGVIEVLDRVAARNDQSVAETLEAIPGIVKGLEGNPEGVGAAIREVAEILTVRSPEAAPEPVKPKDGVTFTTREDGVEIATVREGGKVSVMSREQYEKGKQGQNPSLPDETLGDRASERGNILTAPLTVAVEAARDPVEAISSGIRSIFQDQIDQLQHEAGSNVMPERMRRAASAAGKNIGEAMTEFEKVQPVLDKLSAEMHELVTVGNIQKARWDALMSRDIQPANAEEAAIADGLNRVYTALWNQAVKTQNVLSKPNPKAGQKGEPDVVHFLATATNQGKVPRVWDKGADAIYDDAAKRMRWFEKLAQDNPAMTGNRPRTAADFEAQHQKDMASVKGRGAEREVALEHIRELDNVSYVFEGQDMLVRDPFEAARRTIMAQGMRNAVKGEFGQEGIPEKVRATLGLDPNKRGAETAIQEWVFGTKNQPGLGGPRQNQRLIDQARKTMVRLQGGEPISAGKGWETWNSLMQVSRSAMTVLSGVRDIPSVGSESYKAVGLKRTAKAVLDVVFNYATARERAVALGTLIPEIGNLNPTEATTRGSRFADYLGEWGKIPLLSLLAPRATERFRHAAATKVAEVALDSWKQNKKRMFGLPGFQPRDGAKQMLEMLKFEPADAAAVAEGRGTPELNERFIREFVRHATSRGASATRSRLASNPYARSLVDFAQYSTKRLYGLAKEVVLAQRVLKPGSGASLGDRAHALKRLAATGVGFALGGAAGDMLYYILADAIEGDVTWENNGLSHYVRDVQSYPWKMLGRAVTGQVLSGPVGLLGRSLLDDPSDAAQALAPVRIWTTGVEALQSWASPKGWAEAVYDTASATGAIPQAGRLKRLGGYLNGVVLGKNTEFADDAQVVNQFRSLEGMPFRERDLTKQRAFYAAIGQIKDFIDKADMDLSAEDASKQIRAAADDAVRTALQLQPEESVAGAVRGLQHLDTLTAEQKVRFADHLKDEKRFERIVAHDTMIAELAQTISQEQGTNPTPFQERLEGAARLAAAKSRNAWNKLVSDAVEDAAVARMSGSASGQELQELASRMSLHPESVELDDTLGDEDKKAWARMQTQPRRERFLAKKFRDRMDKKVDALRARR